MATATELTGRGARARRDSFVRTSIAVAGLLGSAGSPAQGEASPAMGYEAGLIGVRQNDSGNAQTSVTLSAVAGTAGFRVVGGNRGDYDVRFGTAMRSEAELGVAISSVRNLARSNAADGDRGGNVDEGSPPFATSAMAVAQEPWGWRVFLPVFQARSGEEMNADLGVVYFPFAEGWIAGRCWNSQNNGPMTTMVASSGVRLGRELVDPASSAGVYELDLRSKGATGDRGVLLVNGATNEDNYALSRANAEGTFTIMVHDNGANGTGHENDPAAFVYVPLDTPGVVAGRVAERDGSEPELLVGGSGITLTGIEPGRVLLRIEGVAEEAAGVLLVSAEGSGRGADNTVVHAWDGSRRGWVVETRDLPGAELQGMGGEAMFSFAWFPLAGR